MRSPNPPSSGALQLLEDAIHLFRAAPFPTLAWYWVGSLPFAIGSAFFFHHVTHPRSAGSTLASDALMLTALLAWMNVCRAIYAGRLRAHLAGTPNPQLNASALWRLAPALIFLGATKLIVLPLAIVSAFLLAPTVAFYRNLAALSGREDIDGMAIGTEARRLAGHRPIQNWKALGLLACLYPMVLVNIALTLMMLPQLLRILTGFESAFSRLGANLFESSTFWVFSLLFTWLALDPYVQAVYCVRCFEAESAATGEDIRSKLRLLRGASRAVAGVLVLAVMIGAVAPLMQAADTAPPADLQRAVQQAAQSPEYDWRITPSATDQQQAGWFVRATDRIVNGTRAFFHSVGNAVDTFFRWLFRRSSSRESRDTSLPVAALPISVYVLIALILAVCGFAYVRMRNAARSQPVAAVAGSLVATPKDAEEMDPLRFPEQSWIDLAERCLAEENWRLAMRAFYLASLAWLGRREFIQVHSGKTNREYELELRRRTRAAPHVRGLFAKNVAAFERCWYGMHDLDAADVDGFRSHMREIQTSLETAA